MSENKENPNESGEKKTTIVIKHEGLFPPKEEKKEGETTPTTPATPVTPPTTPQTVQSVEEYQTKMTKLEDDYKKQLADMQTKIKTMEEEGETTKAELESERAKLTALALAEFEKQKGVVVDAVKQSLGEEKANEVAEKIVDPAALESAKMWVNYISSAIKKGTDEKEDETKIPPTAPAGQATRQPPTGATHGSAIELIDEIVEKIESRTSTPEEKKKANAMLDQLLTSMITGYKKGLERGFAGGLSRCPRCSRTVFGYHCPVCNIDIPRR